MKLLIIGSSNLDLVISVPRIPAVGETILGKNSRSEFGGKGANQAVAAIRAGGDIAFLSKLGTDKNGEEIKSLLIQEGLSPAYILQDKKEATGIAQIWVSDKGENSIVVAPGANMKLTADDLLAFESEIREAEIILVQLETPLQTIEWLASFAKENNKRLILNPAPAQALSNQVLEKIWLLTPNETEASLLTNIKVHDEKSAAMAGLALIEKGVAQVLITLGEKGCMWCTPKSCQHFPAFKEKAIDTTAAGDVFNGTLAVALSNNWSIEKAIQFASAAAAISVTREGAQSSIPVLSEIEAYLQKSILSV